MKAKCRLKVTFLIESKVMDWNVHVVPIRNSVPLGYDLMKVHNVAIHTRRQCSLVTSLCPPRW